MGLPDEAFYVPDDVRELYRAAGARGRDDREAWEKRLDAYDGDRAALDATLGRHAACPAGRTPLPTWAPGEQGRHPRRQRQGPPGPRRRRPRAPRRRRRPHVEHRHRAEGPRRPVRRRARPAGSSTSASASTRMAAAMNGMALHGGVLPVGGTFLVFSDYCRPSVRLAALSRAKVIYSFTHDSVGVGEDGPTHQPVEHVAALRAIPGLRVIRPADANETAEAWRLAVEHDGPTALILSRQDLPVLEGTAGVEPGSRRPRAARRRGPRPRAGGHGSEVHVARGGRRAARRRGHPRPGDLARRAGSCSTSSPTTVQDEVLPPEVPTLSVEAGVSLGWDRWADDSRRHRALRRVGPRRPGAGRARVHPRARGRTSPGAAPRPGGASSEPDRTTRLHELHAAGPEPVARQPPPRLAHRAASWPRWVDRGIRGLTSNPSIFQKAISTGTDYDEQFGDLISGGTSVTDAYWDLVTTDIEGALALLRPVYDEQRRRRRLRVGRGRPRPRPRHRPAPRRPPARSTRRSTSRTST